MGIRKGIFIGAAALSIMACAACGSSEEMFQEQMAWRPRPVWKAE